MMKRSSKKIKILIIVIGVLFVFSLNFFQKEIKNFLYLISAPIQKTLWLAGDRVSDFFEIIFEETEETDKLELEIKTLLAENIRLRELKKENETLRKALEIGLAEEFALTFARIVGKDIAQDSILINQGARDGILKGFPVITEQKILLGRISDVYENFSRVQLISHLESSFSAKIVDSEVFGRLIGKGNFKVFFDLIPKDKKIEPGDLVVTAIQGGEGVLPLPRGLLLGSVSKVKRDGLNPFQSAKISSFFEIKEIKNIFVIIDY